MQTVSKIASIEHIQVGDATAIYVKLKSYNYEITINQNIEVASVEEIKQKLYVSKESDIGVTHMTEDEWTAEVPTDNWFASEDYYVTSWAGSGTEDDPYLIEIEEQLAGLSWKVANGETYEDKYFKLTKDLSMGKHIWVPIGGKRISSKRDEYYYGDTSYCFKGIFDGENNSIFGIYYVGNSSQSNYGYYAGVFGYVTGNNSKIKNLQIKDGYIEGYNYVGGIVGMMGSGNEINKCYNYNVIKAKKIGGGIARKL